MLRVLGRGWVRGRHVLWVGGRALLRGRRGGRRQIRGPGALMLGGSDGILVEYHY
jgi:hypothetical protein